MMAGEELRTANPPSSPLLGRQPLTICPSATDRVYEDNALYIALGGSTTGSASPNQSLTTPTTEESSTFHDMSPHSSSPIKTIHEPRDTPNESLCLEGITYGSVNLLQPWFPNVNPTHPRAKTWRTRIARREVVLWACFLTASTICIINFVLAGILWPRSKSSSDGIVTLYQGDCTVVKRMDTLSHFFINVLSTLLMGASNMILQLIVAPTRKEVDKAHSAGTWLDIGVPSFRNLKQISRVSCAIWCCIALSSIPIHFLYNATVFSSVSTNDVAWVVATEIFLTGEEWPANTTTGNTTAKPGGSAYHGVKLDRGTHSAMPDDGSFAAVSMIHNEYHRNARLYDNHTTYDLLIGQPYPCSVLRAPCSDPHT